MGLSGSRTLVGRLVVDGGSDSVGFGVTGGGRFSLVAELSDVPDPVVSELILSNSNF